MLFSLLRCLRTQFSMILSQIWDGFCMFFGTFSWHLPCQKTCDRSSPPAAERLFGAHFWHALGTKSAMTRTTHFLGQKTCDRSSHPSAGKFFGANFSNTLGTKSAITRRIQPQHSFSKGGGFAKRPQLKLIQTNY